ncbi:acyltransferase family protein [Flavobacterium sp.]|uniref:acyltransferase family protein n=1 Tax=Flavobacterium sp. TaxID=239 RepID=UPI0038FC34DF
MSVEINNRRPSLDGLRAISIFMVIYDHAFRPELIHFGTLGVTVFYIISSYLIVGMLLRDVEKNRFSINTFYFKRILRIFPAYYFYLLVLAIILLSLEIFKWSQFWRAPLFLVNYQPRSSWTFPQWFVGHTWSLAVEEQFYILIAILFFFVNKQVLNKQKLLYILIFIVCITPFIRVSYLYFNGIPDILKGSLHRSFETVADSLAIGGIIAIIENFIINKKIFHFFKNKTIIFITFILVLMILDSSLVVGKLGLKPRYLYNLVGLTIINICIGLVMMLYVHFPKDNNIAKLLNHKIMVTIGLWSYSIYLWQQLWLYSWNFSIYYKFIGILICSVLSYYFIELPFLKIRDNYLRKNIHNDF